LEKNYFLWSTKNATDNKENKLIVPNSILAEPFGESLEQLVRHAQKVAKKVVLITFSTRIRAQQSEQEKKESSVTSLYYMPYIQPNGFARYFAAYNETIRKISRQTGAQLVGDENSIPGTKKYFKDSVHFTDTGSRLMAKRIANALVNTGTVANLP
jgi:lysophospholipase L1-like esterase